MMKLLTSQKAADNALIIEKLTDALTPGLRIDFDPDEAMQAGAFLEDALTEIDAFESEAIAWEVGCE